MRFSRVSLYADDLSADFFATGRVLAAIPVLADFCWLNRKVFCLQWHHLKASSLTNIVLVIPLKLFNSSPSAEPYFSITETPNTVRAPHLRFQNLGLLPAVETRAICLNASTVANTYWIFTA